MDKKKVKVNIDGVEYTLSVSETEEYVQNIAKSVDDLIREIKKRHFTLDSQTAAVLTAVNFAGENAKLRKEIEEAKNELEALRRNNGQNFKYKNKH